MTLPTASEIQYFVEVAKTGHISRAAQRIGISQPTLTQAIQRLEASVGTPLLVRTRKGVTLTRAGEKVLNQSSALLETWRSLRKKALEEETSLSGRFRLGCHPAVGTYFLPSFFLTLQKTAPQIEIELFHALSRQVADAVVDRSVDFGIVINPPPHPELVLKKIGADTVTIFESESRTGDLIFGDAALKQTQHILKTLEKTRLKKNPFVSCSSLEVVRALAAAGAGYGILPTRVARSSPGLKTASGGTEVLPEFKDSIVIAYRREMMGSQSARAVLEAARNALESGAAFG